MAGSTPHRIPAVPTRRWWVITTPAMQGGPTDARHHRCLRASRFHGARNRGAPEEELQQHLGLLAGTAARAGTRDGAATEPCAPVCAHWRTGGRHLRLLDRHL